MRQLAAPIGLQGTGKQKLAPVLIHSISMGSPQSPSYPAFHPHLSPHLRQRWPRPYGCEPRRRRCWSCSALEGGTEQRPIQAQKHNPAKRSRLSENKRLLQGNSSWQTHTHLYGHVYMTGDSYGFGVMVNKFFIDSIDEHC